MEFRQRIARLRLAWGNAPIIAAPTYADDGLILQHIVDFLSDSQFMNAYAIGKESGALDQHPGDIHFRAYVACWAAKHALSLEGDFVECGVGKGLLSKTIVTYLGFENIDKKFYLFDTFEGIPVDDAENNAEHSNMTHLNKLHFAGDYSDEIRARFSKYDNVKIIKGRVPATLHESKLEKLSYVSIDMNNASAEISAIEYLWDHLVSGGIVLLDDYAYSEEFRAQKNAWDSFAKKRKIEILTLPTGQGLILKSV